MSIKCRLVRRKSQDAYEIKPFVRICDKPPCPTNCIKLGTRMLNLIQFFFYLDMNVMYIKLFIFVHEYSVFF